jgi:hypothetical protein
MRIEVTGFSHSHGISKQGKGEEYTICRLFRLTEIRGWKNDHGESVTVGFEATDRNALNVDAKPNLIEQLKSYTYPITLELQVAPDPRDEMRNIVVGATPVKSEVKG